MGTTTLTIEEPRRLHDDPAREDTMIHQIEATERLDGGDRVNAQITQFTNETTRSDFVSASIHVDQEAKVRSSVYTSGNLAISIGNCSFWIGVEQAEAVALAVLKAAAEHRAGLAVSL
jgi:hypothetical protein